MNATCHPNRPHCARGLCKECWGKAYHSGRLEDHSLVRKKGTAKCHPDRPVSAHGLCKSCYQILYRRRNPKAKGLFLTSKNRYDRSRKGISARIKREHGITIDEYESMITDQENKCAICNGELLPKPHIDHDHVTGKIRGLLCKTCNWGLGHFKDNPEIMRSAANYIELSLKKEN